MCENILIDNLLAGVVYNGLCECHNQSLAIRQIVSAVNFSPFFHTEIYQVYFTVLKVVFSFSLFFIQISLN